MPTLTDRQGETRRYGDSLALALYDLAVAERINPPTAADLERWRSVVQPQGIHRNWAERPLETPGVYYHGTAADFAGIPAPSPDRGDFTDLWPTAIFMSPAFKKAQRLGEYKIEFSQPKRGVRVMMGAVDDHRIHQIPMPQVESYQQAIEWTNLAIEEDPRAFDPNRPDRFTGIKPPNYPDYWEDANQVLIFHPLDIRWLDVFTDRRHSTRYLRELADLPGNEWLAQWRDEADEAAERYLRDVDLDALRAYEWRSHQGQPGKEVMGSRYPSTFMIEPALDLGFTPMGGWMDKHPRMAEFYREQIGEARRADEEARAAIARMEAEKSGRNFTLLERAMSNRDRIRKLTEAIDNYMDWRGLADQYPNAGVRRVAERIGFPFGNVAPEDITALNIAKWREGVRQHSIPNQDVTTYDHAANTMARELDHLAHIQRLKLPDWGRRAWEEYFANLVRGRRADPSEGYQRILDAALDYMTWRESEDGGLRTEVMEQGKPLGWTPSLMPSDVDAQQVESWLASIRQAREIYQEYGFTPLAREADNLLDGLTRLHALLDAIERHPQV